MCNVRGLNVMLHLKPGSKAFIFNKGSDVAQLRRGLIVAGFGKGNYKRGSDLGEDAGKSVVFELKSPSDLVSMSLGLALKLKP